MLVLEEEADSRRDVLRQRRLNDKHYVYDRVFGEGSTQVRIELQMYWRHTKMTVISISLTSPRRTNTYKIYLKAIFIVLKNIYAERRLSSLDSD